jgi:hypothetical protein
MMKNIFLNSCRYFTIGTLYLALVLGLSGCVGQVIGAATDVVIETAKVPVKVGKGVVDVVLPDDE